MGPGRIKEARDTPDLLFRGLHRLTTQGTQLFCTLCHGHQSWHCVSLYRTPLIRPEWPSVDFRSSTLFILSASWLLKQRSQHCLFYQTEPLLVLVKRSGNFRLNFCSSQNCRCFCDRGGRSPETTKNFYLIFCVL